MNRTKEPVDAFASKVERSVAKRFRDIHTTQSFDGTLRVKVESVYVGKKDGERALAHLRELQANRGKGK